MKSVALLLLACAWSVANADELAERKDMIEWKKAAEKSMHDAAMPAIRNMK